MYYTPLLSSYIDAMESESVDKWRTLHGVVPVRRPDGRVWCYIGGVAVVFKVRYQGRLHRLKCYITEKHNLRHIYGYKYYESELYVEVPLGPPVWADVILDKWYEGDTLEEELKLSPSFERIAELSEMFRTLAVELLSQEWAHGDIKPENIIVKDNRMELIDFDGLYSSTFSGCECEEGGTPGFQHPCRNDMYAKEIDDYSIALLYAMLRAMIYDSSLSQRYYNDGTFIISPYNLIFEGKDDGFDYVMSLLARNCDIRAFRIGELLKSKEPALPQLRELLSMKLVHRRSNEQLETYSCGNKWGFRDSQGIVIEPLFDLAFDFSEDVAAVKLGSSWCFIDRFARLVIPCSEYEAVKPFNNGVAVVVKDGRRMKIDKSGNVVAELLPVR